MGTTRGLAWELEILRRLARIQEVSELEEGGLETPSRVFYAECQEWRCCWRDTGMCTGLRRAHPHAAIHALYGPPGPPREERILNFYKKTDLQLGEGMNLLGKRGKC